MTNKVWGVCDVFTPFIERSVSYSPFKLAGVMQKRGLKGIWLPKAHRCKSFEQKFPYCYPIACQGTKKSWLVEHGILVTFDRYETYLREHGVSI